MSSALLISKNKGRRWYIIDENMLYTVSADYCYFVIVQVSLISTARHGPYTRRIQKLQCQWWRCQWYSSKTGLFWFFIIFLDFNLFTIIGTSGRAWCRNEGKYGTATDIVFTPTKNIYDIVTSDLLISWQINCQTKVSQSRDGLKENCQ